VWADEDGWACVKVCGQAGGRHEVGVHDSHVVVIVIAIVAIATCAITVTSPDDERLVLNGRKGGCSLNDECLAS
jgi:hypothetical protein